MTRLPVPGALPSGEACNVAKEGQQGSPHSSAVRRLVAVDRAHCLFVKRVVTTTWSPTVLPGWDQSRVWSSRKSYRLRRQVPKGPRGATWRPSEASAPAVPSVCAWALHLLGQGPCRGCASPQRAMSRP